LTEIEDRTVTVILVPVGKAPRVITIPATLKAQQALVGGLIEPIQVDDRISVVVNEEGLLRDLPPNRRVGRFDLVGDFYIAAWNEEGEIVSLDAEDLPTLVGLLAGMGGAP